MKMLPRGARVALAVYLAFIAITGTAEGAFHLAHSYEPSKGLRFAPDEMIGMKTAPAPVYEPLEASGRSVAVPVRFVQPASRWDCIAKWESGNRALPCNPYCSRLQWLPSTWRAAGGTRYAPTPQQATWEQEKAVADAWLARTSWAQWPQTSRRCGYR